jgi:hypothetical protein
MPYFCIVDVPKIRQDSPMSCWFAAAQMVQGAFVLGPAMGMGAESKALFDKGLNNGRYVEFADKNNLANMDNSEDEIMSRARSYRRQSPGVTFQSLVYLLNSYGPIWTVIRLGKHAVVLTGVSGNGDGDAEVLYNDPASGTECKMPLTRFNSQVQWECKGIFLHYKGGTSAPTRRKVISCQHGVWPYSMGI